MISVKTHNKLVPMGTQVSSKGRFRFCDGYGPEWIVEATGCRVMDETGREYIDTTGGLGALVLGHDAMRTRAPAAYPLPSSAEAELVQYLNANVTGCESMRFMKTGSDVTQAAIRLARVHTGRSGILDLGSYHGWSDAFITPEHAGVPQSVRDWTWRTADPEKITKDVAAVIVEPWPLTGLDLGMLGRIRERCNETGTVLIYDEVISGFRCGMSGVQDHGAPKPDLVCAGKALGNGWPISVIYGKPEIMNLWSNTHMSGTHFADPACMEGALEVLRQTGGTVMFRDEPPRLPKPFEVVGTKMWWCVKGDALPMTVLQKRLLDRGWLTNFSHFTYRDLKRQESAYAAILTAEAHEVATMSEVQMQLDLDGVPLNRTVFRRNA